MIKNRTSSSEPVRLIFLNIVRALRFVRHGLGQKQRHISPIVLTLFLALSARLLY